MNTCTISFKSTIFTRFRLELYDFDPNLEDSYEENSIEDLNVILNNLDREEEKEVNEIKEKYLKLHQMYLRYSQLKRPEQNSSCPDISNFSMAFCQGQYRCRFLLV